MISPKLRFSQFIEKKEILEIQLGLIGEFKNGINFSPALKGSGILTVDVYNMYGPGIETKLDSLYRVNIIAEESILKKNDILFVRSSLKREGVGWATLFPGSVEPILFCGFLIRFRINSDHLVDPRYLTYFLRSDNGRKEITNASGTGTITNISQESLKKILAPVPVLLAEQQKIAACLSSLDNLIAAESEKLEVLKEHKKGLLQNLFPGEGESVPRVRFREFEESGNWEKEGVGELFIFKQGIQIPIEEQALDKDENMVRFIRIIDITSTNEPLRYITNPGNDYILNKMDLFMIRYGTPGVISIGYEGVIANNLFRLIWKGNSKFVPKFWFYAFQRIEKYIYDLSSSSSMPAISFSTMTALDILFPSNNKEQEKIAETLSIIDTILDNQVKKIEELKLHKKGLLQGLFPTITEEN